MKNYVLEVQKELQELKATMTDEEFFSSNIFFRFMENYINGIVKGWKRGKSIVVQNLCEPKSNLTACTDGYLVKNNTYDSIIQKLDSRSDKYYANCGKVCHEIWHILYTNFQTHNAHVEAWKQPEFEWLVKPTNPNADVVKKEINENKNIRKLMFKLMLNVANIYEDAYINIKGCLAMSGVPSTGFVIYNNELIMEYGSLNKIMKNDIVTALMMVMHLESMKAPLEVEEPLSEDEENLYKIIRSVLDPATCYTEALLYESNGKERARLVDEVLISIFPIIKTLSMMSEMAKEGGEGEDGESEESSESKESGSNSFEKGESSEDTEGTSSSGGSESDSSESSSNSDNSGSDGSEKSSDISERELEKILESLEEKLSETEMPKGNTTPVEDDYDKDEAEKKAEELSEKMKSSESESDSGEDAFKKAFESIEDEIMEDISKKKVERDHTSDLKREGREIMEDLKKSSYSDFTTEKKFGGDSEPSRLEYEGTCAFDYNIRRMTGIRNELIRAYERDYSHVQEYADVTVRQLKKILKDQDKSMYSSGYRMGRLDHKAVAKSEFYQDGKIFRRRNEKSVTDVCFSLLIDESGSMCCYGKTEKARLTAILLEAVLSELNVPFMITGHTQLGRDDVTMDIYKDFESVDGDDKYRLAGITASGNNIDGMAIAYNCEKLLQRHEKKKILIVISDGEPAGYGISPNDNMSLAINMVQKYRKKGIEVFGAVIDGDKDQIAKIYSDRTMDCTDLESLSPELCGLVKRFIVKR